MNIVHERDHLVVYKVKGGYVIHNTKRKFNDESHSHIKKLEVAKKIINEVSVAKYPPTYKSNYLLSSYIRISNVDSSYYHKIEQYAYNRKNKSGNGKFSYYNVNKKIK